MALLKPPHKPELNCSPLDDPSLKVLISRSKCQILQFLHKNSLFSHDYSGQLGYHNLCSGSPHSNMHLLFRWGCPFPPPRREVQSLTHTHTHTKTFQVSPGHQEDSCTGLRGPAEPKRECSSDQKSAQREK